MMTSFVVTILGPDRPGLVEALSQTIADHQGNWMESRMAQLAGRFAGLLRVSVPAAQAEALAVALQENTAADLTVIIESSDATTTVASGYWLNLELIGQDRPGIVHDMTHVLAELKVNVEEFSSECIDASMSGETLFQAEARLRVPESLPSGRLREALEGLADQLMVDIKLDETTET